MARGDGKNKFYRQLDLPKEVKLLLRMYNKVWKPQALREIRSNNSGFTGKT
jgi:hypothetical protein